MRVFLITTIIFLLVVTVLQADVLQDLEQYIYARTSENVKVVNPKCAFREQLVLQTHLSQLSPDLQKMAATFLPRPSRQYQMVSPSGHFTLHYDLSGLHAVPPEDQSGNGIPDFIDSAAVILDHVWQVEIEQLGFRPPPDADGNPVQSYPVYFSSMSYYGLTNFDVNEDIAALPGNNYVSYLELHNDFEVSNFATKGLEALKVTAAHEFHHAIQLGYQFRWTFQNGLINYPDLFFLEMSSTFMEDYVYDAVNDYVQYVNRLIPVLESKAFNAVDGNSEYANGLFLHLLTQKFGIEIFRKIWENLVTYPALSAIDYTLQDYGSSFAQCFSEYGSWFYFTGQNSRQGQYFRDASLFTQFRIKYSENWLENPLLPLHMRFNLLSVESSGVYLARVSSSQNGGTFTHIADGANVLKPVAWGEEQVFPQHSTRPLVAIVTNSSLNSLDDVQYQLSKAPTRIKNNPVKITPFNDGVTFLYLPPNSKITIFNVLGQKVITLQGTTETNLYWDLRNLQGQAVPSGIYFFQVQAEGLNSFGKLTVLR